MSKPKHVMSKVRNAVCACGAGVYLLGEQLRTGSFCPVCRHVRAQIMEALHRPHGGALPLRGDEARRVRDTYYAAWLAGEALPFDYVQPRNEMHIHQCAYCGNATTADGAYCLTCVREGYAYVHSLTGKTTGWNVAPRTRVQVVGGLRGQSGGGGKADNTLDYFRVAVMGRRA